MSKKVVKKKAAQEPITPNGGAAGGKAAVETDARVAQQMRVLEVVGASGRGIEKDDKKYSPRTEGHIKKLTDVLDYFEYSRADIASLVRRCHYDEQQIQIAVANIVEDRANHEQSQWGTVKTKKQVKEEKRLKEEDEKREQDRIEREMEKQRKEADKRAAKEHARQAYLAREVAGAVEPASLPPDPAILFANPKPGVMFGDVGQSNDDEWWEGAGSGSTWEGQEWMNKGKSRNAKASKGADRSWEDWNWQQGQWEKAEWNESNGDGQWWQGDWEKAGGASPEDGNRGKRAKEQKGAGLPRKPEMADAMWDMPDATTAVNDGGLDMYALGDIRAHERRVAAEGGNLGAEVTPTEGTMRTVEEIEREQFGATGGSGSTMVGGKSPIEALLQAPLQSVGASDATAAAVPTERAERSRGRGAGKAEKGKGRGADRSNGGGSGAVDRDRPDRNASGDNEKGGEHRDRGERKERARADSGGRGRDGEVAAGGESADAKDRIERLDRSDDPRRQAVEEVGDNVTVRKHSSMGCAVISMREPSVREAILRLGSDTFINGIRVQMKPHFDKDTRAEVPTDVFVAWGRQVEKTTPLSERELVKHFDAKHTELTAGWRAEAEEKARQAQEEQRARQQKLLEEQQRQQAEQREREEQQRRFAEEMTRGRADEEQRQAAEAQRKLAEEQQRRQEEQRRLQRENQAKWINGLQGNWAHSGGTGIAAAGAQDPRATAAAATALGASAPGVPGATSANATAAGTADAMTTSAAAGLNAVAPVAYPQTQWSAAQAQQWIQAVYAQQAQGWQQQMAQQSMAQRGMAGAMHPSQDYDSQLRAHAQAYYAAMAYDQQQRGQSVAAAAYAQQQQQGAYPQGAAFGYNAAAAYGRGGERI